MELDNFYGMRFSLPCRQHQCRLLRWYPWHLQDGGAKTQQEVK